MAAARIILAIETSNPSAWEEGQKSRPGVAVGRVVGDEVEVLGARGLDPTRPHDDELMPEIAGMLQGLGVRPRDLTDIAVSVGPGGYTAVRLAVTTAKLIAEGTGARAVPVPSALVAAWGMSERVRATGVERFGVAISSKGDSTFLSLFEVEGSGARATDAGAVVKADGLEAALGGVRVVAGDRFLPPAIRERLVGMGVEVVVPEFDPVACLRASVGLGAVEPLELLPLYAREPEAVTKWRELGKGRA